MFTNKAIEKLQIRGDKVDSQGSYYWVRIYDYAFERDMYEKGTMLDEYYLEGVLGGREVVKKEVKNRYCSNSSASLKFAKPKRQSNGIYAIVMDSTKFYYDRFYFTINTHCFWCHTPISGKASEFPRSYIGEGHFYESTDEMFTDLEETAYLCSYKCKSLLNSSQNTGSEGVFQSKEEGRNGEVFGYIYLIYNRLEDTYYIGQTRFMPFFRWQEHVKDGSKGDISNLSFTVLAEVNRNKGQNDEQNQTFLNNIEAWWIAKYLHEQYKVFNITKPKITIQYLKDKFQEMVLKQSLLLID